MRELVAQFLLLCAVTMMVGITWLLWSVLHWPWVVAELAATPIGAILGVLLCSVVVRAALRVTQAFKPKWHVAISSATDGGVTLICEFLIPLVIILVLITYFFGVVQTTRHQHGLAAEGLATSPRAVSSRR